MLMAFKNIGLQGEKSGIGESGVFFFFRCDNSWGALVMDCFLFPFTYCCGILYYSTFIFLYWDWTVDGVSYVFVLAMNVLRGDNFFERNGIDVMRWEGIMEIKLI